MVILKHCPYVRKEKVVSPAYKSGSPTGPCVANRQSYPCVVPNEIRTSPTHGTPAFTLAPRDWAFYVAAEQRKLVMRTVPKGSAVPTAQELAQVIRKYAAPKRTAVRGLIEAAQAVADAGDLSIPYLRLRAALAAARKQFR